MHTVTLYNVKKEYTCGIKTTIQVNAASEFLAIAGKNFGLTIFHVESDEDKTTADTFRDTVTGKTYSILPPADKEASVDISSIIPNAEMQAVTTAAAIKKLKLAEDEGALTLTIRENSELTAVIRIKKI